MLCGIDEAGRGPIAGDLVIAGCILHSKIDGLNDSKKLTPKRREELYEQIISQSSYHIVKIPPNVIDTNGISLCMKRALLEIKSTLVASSYLFDGNTNFGVIGIETMIKADGKVAEVSAASIIAKVTHDRDILDLDLLYPHYDLAKHKGYATALHIERIKEYGYSPIHRKSFRLKALIPTLDL